MYKYSILYCTFFSYNALMNIKTINQAPLFIAIGLVFIGMVFRLYNFPVYSFLFDQVQIYENSQHILQGDLTLIGPRTGPAEMFTGPLIYYLNALSLLITNSPFSLVITANIISLTTGISLIFLTRRYLHSDYHILIPLLWATSPMLINLDRVAWNPNISLLATSLSFFPLLKTKKLNLVDILIVSIGAFLGYQAHFGGLFLAPLIILGLLITRRFNPLPMISVVAATIFSLVPTVVFDLKNDWLNLRGLLALTSNSVEVNRRISVLDILKMIKFHLENLGLIVFANNHSSLIITAGITFLILFLLSRKITQAKILVCTWIIAIITVFSLYRRPIPEYYLLILYPAFIYIIASVIQPLWNLSLKVSLPKVKTKEILFNKILVLGLITLAGLSTVLNFSKKRVESMATALEVQAKVNSLSSSQPVKSIVYDTEDIYTIGWRYLLQDIKTDQKGFDYHLVFPYTTGHLITQKIEPDLAIWVDERTDQSKSYLSQPDHIIEYPKDLAIYEDLNNKPYNSRYSYLIFNSSNQPIARLFMIPEEQYVPEFTELEIDTQTSIWKAVLIENKTWYYYKNQKTTYLLEPLEDNFDITTINILTN